MDSPFSNEGPWQNTREFCWDCCLKGSCDSEGTEVMKSMHVLLVYLPLFAPFVLALLFPFPYLVRLLLAIVASMISWTLFLLVARLRSQTIFPSRSRKDHFNALAAVVGWMTSWQRESFIIEDLKCKRTLSSGFLVSRVGAFLFRLPNHEELLKLRGIGSILSLLTGLPGVILVEGHSAVLTKRGIIPYRVLGPGTNFSHAWESAPTEEDGEAGEKIPEIVDLRRQFRFLRVNDIQTKDGLYCNAGFFAIFEIDRDSDPEFKLKRYYRYSDEAVRKAVQALRIGPKPEESSGWSSLPTIYGVDTLLNLLALYSLDELYAPRDAGSLSARDLRRRINGRVTEVIRPKLKEQGIHLIYAGVTTIVPSSMEVVKQRVRNWRAEWQSRIDEEKADVRAQVIEEMGKVRANAQSHILVGISEELIKIAEEHRANLQVLRFIVGVENMVKEAARTPELSPQIENPPH